MWKISKTSINECLSIFQKWIEKQSLFPKTTNPVPMNYGLTEPPQKCIHRMYKNPSTSKVSNFISLKSFPKCQTTLIHLLFFPLVYISNESLGRIFPRWCANTGRPSDHRIIQGSLMQQILWFFLQFRAVNTYNEKERTSQVKGEMLIKYKSFIIRSVNIDTLIFIFFQIF